MSGATAVAKKKPESRPKAGKKERPKWLDRPQKPVVAQVRGSTEFKEWLDRFSKKDMRNISDLVSKALAEYAAKVGFDPPPER